MVRRTSMDKERLFVRGINPDRRLVDSELGLLLDEPLPGQVNRTPAPELIACYTLCCCRDSTIPSNDRLYLMLAG